MHSEASFVAGYRPATVLDAGCGTGRVAVELAARGIATVGVDLDPAALETARSRSSQVRWLQADLTTLRIARGNGEPVRFHVVVAAGGVMVFLQKGTQPAVVSRMADHLVAGGLFVAGFQLVDGAYSLAAHDDACGAAGLEPYERFSSWSRDPFRVDGGYVVAVHRRPVT